MADIRRLPPQKRSRQTQVLIAGGVIGALLGVGSAYLLWQAREQRVQRTGEEVPLLSGGDALKLGGLAVALFRQIREMAGRNQ